MMWRVATYAGVVQWLVYQPSKLRMRVRSPSLAPFADMVELADMQDLGSCAEKRMGSSPIVSTIWTLSSVGQSIWLITGRSWVRVPEGPPLPR